MPSIAEIIRKYKAYECMECGKCAALCPVTRAGDTYGPRRAVRDLMDGEEAKLSSCRTCGSCETRCPMGVEYIDMIQALREEGASDQAIPGCAHSGMFQTLAEMMAEDDFPQERLKWVNDDLKVAEQGEVLYFVGCAPYFDAYFQDHRGGALEGVKNGIRLQQPGVADAEGSPIMSPIKLRMPAQN